MNQQEINASVKKFNTFINFVNTKIDNVLSREGELPSSYFVEDLEARLDALCDTIKTRQDVCDNIVEIKAVYALLKDGYKGLQVAGKY